MTLPEMVAAVTRLVGDRQGDVERVVRDIPESYLSEMTTEQVANGVKAERYALAAERRGWTKTQLMEALVAGAGAELLAELEPSLAPAPPPPGCRHQRQEHGDAKLPCAWPPKYCPDGVEREFCQVIDRAPARSLRRGPPLSLEEAMKSPARWGTATTYLRAYDAESGTYSWKAVPRAGA